MIALLASVHRDDPERAPDAVTARSPAESARAEDLRPATQAAPETSAAASPPPLTPARLAIQPLDVPNPSPSEWSTFDTPVMQLPVDHDVRPVAPIAEVIMVEPRVRMLRGEPLHVTFELRALTSPPPVQHGCQLYLRRPGEPWHAIIASMAGHVPGLNQRQQGNETHYGLKWGRKTVPIHFVDAPDRRPYTQEYEFPLWQRSGVFEVKALLFVRPRRPQAEFVVVQSSVMQILVEEPAPIDEAALIDVLAMNSPGARWTRSPEALAASLDEFLQRHGRSAYAPQVMLDRALLHFEFDGVRGTEAMRKMTGERAREHHLAHRELLERILRDFPGFARRDEVLFELARSHDRSCAPMYPVRARACASELATRYPDSPWTHEARRTLPALFSRD